MKGQPKAVFPGPSGNQFELYNGYVIHAGRDSILACQPLAKNLEGPGVFNLWYQQLGRALLG